MKTHSPIKNNKIVNFFDLIDHRVCFDFLLGFYVMLLGENYGKKIYTLSIKMMQKPGTWSTFDNTCFFIKVFCSAFKNSKSYILRKTIKC